MPADRLEPMLVEERIEIFGCDVLLQRSEGRGPVLLFLPGGVVDHIDLTWKPVVRAMARTHAVLAPDLPGFGRSRGLPSGGYSTEFVVDFVLELLAQTGAQRPVLFANSLSGGAGIKLALERPEAFRGLVLSGAYGWRRRVPFHRIVFPFIHAPGSEMLLGRLMRSPRAVRTALRFLVMNQASLTEELIADSIDGSLAPEAPRAFLSWLRNEMKPASLRSDYRARLAELRLPTLILQGAGDWLAPPRHARAAGLAIPRAEYRELPTRHLIPRERPAEVESIIRAFLDRLVPLRD